MSGTIAVTQPLQWQLGVQVRDLAGTKKDARSHLVDEEQPLIMRVRRRLVHMHPVLAPVLTHPRVRLRRAWKHEAILRDCVRKQQHSTP